MGSDSNRFIKFIKNPSFLFAGLLGILLVILKQVEYAYIFQQGEPELILGVLAIIFLCVGLLIYHFLKPAENKNFQVIILNEDSAASNLTKKTYSGPELSEREREILALIADGHSNQEISRTLFISIPTVKTHISNLYQKLDVNSRTKAILKAREFSLIA
jgi:DNA-binding CsgD family transcriptional regulator